MICNWCKNEVQAGNQFCPYCGKPLNNQNNFNEHNNNNDNSFNNNNNNNNNDNNNQKANVWLAILSWFIPLAGLIIFIVKKDTEPKTAKVSGICALISFILSTIIIIISFALLGFYLSNTWDSVNDAIQDNWNEDYNYDYNYDYDHDNSNNNDDLTNNDNNIVDKNQDNTLNTTSTNWKNYEVKINDKTIKLPTTYNELSNATNFEFKESQKTLLLEKNHYTYINLYKNDKLMLTTDIYNDSNENKVYTDCKITSISQTKYQVSTNGATKIIFPGGLKAGDKITENELIALLGTPDDIKEYSIDNYQSKIYKYFEDKNWTTTNNYIITIVNGEINEIQLDNR